MGVFAAISLAGFGIGLLAMIWVIVSRADPHGSLARTGLLAMMVGFAGLLGLIVTNLLG